MIVLCVWKGGVNLSNEMEGVIAPACTNLMLTGCAVFAPYNPQKVQKDYSTSVALPGGVRRYSSAYVLPLNKLNLMAFCNSGFSVCRCYLIYSIHSERVANHQHDLIRRCCIALLSLLTPKLITVFLKHLD